MIIIRSRIPNSEIRKECEDAIPNIEKWFQKNPKRRVCRSEGWYSKMISVRRGHVRADLEDARVKAING